MNLFVSQLLSAPNIENICMRMRIQKYFFSVAALTGEKRTMAYCIWGTPEKIAGAQ